MNKSFLILLTITFFNYIKSFFDKAKYIKNSINGLILDYDKLKNSKINRILNQSKTISNDKKSNDKN